MFILDFFAQSPCKEEWRVLLTVRAAGNPCVGRAAGALCGTQQGPQLSASARSPLLCLQTALRYCPTPLQYLAEVEALEKREGAQKLPFEKPLVDVSGTWLGCFGR